MITQGSPTIAWWLELSVLEIPICVPSLFRRTTEASAASCANPDLCTVIEFTVTSDDPAVRITVVKGILAAPRGAREFAGCVPAETDKLPPCGLFVFPLFPVPVAGVPADIELSLARVIGPT